jgi:hypothetical protein
VNEIEKALSNLGLSLGMRFDVDGRHAALLQPTVMPEIATMVSHLIWKDPEIVAQKYLD